MGYVVGMPLEGAATEKDYQVRFGKNMMWQEEVRSPHLPAEWALQSGVQLTWPHEDTDWAPMLDEVERCFMDIAREVARRERLLIVHPRPEEIKEKLTQAGVPMECDTNDTWARDHGAITMLDTDGPSLLDFTFNGWGLKFAADKDNRITRRLVEAGCLKGAYVNRLGFVLEGGSIESDGMGTLLTTSQCLLSPNRNGQMNRVEIEEYLRRTFHLQRVLWLDHGYLKGDDTDSHVDTLARFCGDHRLRAMREPDGRTLRGTVAHGGGTESLPHGRRQALSPDPPPHARPRHHQRRTTARHVCQLPHPERRGALSHLCPAG